jgi:hypothetical protein
MKCSRRRFVESLPAGMLGVVTAGSGLHSLEVEQPDEPWLRNLRSKHKQFFDVPTTSGGTALRRAGSFLEAYNQAYGIADSEMSVIFGAHSGGLGFVLSDHAWSEHALGSLWGIDDPATGARAIRNIFNAPSDGVLVPPQLKCDSYPLHTMQWEPGGVDEQGEREATAVHA